jgi:transposase
MNTKRIGIDLAKQVFQLHGVDRTEKVVVRKQLRRSQMHAYFKALPPALVGMEALWQRALLGQEKRSAFRRMAVCQSRHSAEGASLFRPIK